MRPYSALPPLLAALLLGCGLAACGGSSDNAGAPLPSSSTSTSTGTSGTGATATGTTATSTTGTTDTTGTGTASSGTGITGTGSAATGIAGATTGTTGSGTGIATGATTPASGLGATTPGSPGVGTATSPTSGTVLLSARVTAAPADGGSGTITCNFLRVDVTGTGMKNVELVPADALSPVMARFSVATDGSFATLDFSTLPKGTTMRVRILAWDAPAGQPGSSVVAMEPRTWNIGDPAKPPCLSPGSLTG